MDNDKYKNKGNLENSIFNLALPIAEHFECELVAVELIKEDEEWYLRIYIDKDGGIKIDDCAAVSRMLSTKLDETDPIEYSYYLEVSSPGLNRLLKRDSDFIKFIGSKIKIKFIKPFEGKENLEGILRGLDNDDGKVLLEFDGILHKIDRSITLFIRLNDF